MTWNSSLVLQRGAACATIVLVALVSIILYATERYQLQFIVLLALYGTILISLARRVGMLDARTLFFLSGIVYSTAGSVDYYLFDDFGGYGEELNAKILFVGSASLAVAGAYLIAAARDSDPASRPIILESRIAQIWVLSFVLLVAYLTLSIRAFGLEIGDLDRATLTSEQSAMAATTRNVLVASLLVWGWCLRHRRSEVLHLIAFSLCVLCLSVFDLVYFGDRRITLCMLLGLAYLRLNRSRALLWFLPTIVAVIGGLILFAAVRGQPIDEWANIVMSLELYTYLTPVNLDFGGFPLIAADIFSSSRPLLSAAPTYFDGVLAAIPAVIYPERPMAFSGWYVNTFYSDVAAIGGGLASNWVMESFVNLGPPGPILIGLATAALLNRFCSARSRMVRLGNAASIAAFAFIMRYDFTTFLQIVGAITVVAVLLALYVSRDSVADESETGPAARPVPKEIA